MTPVKRSLESSAISPWTQGFPHAIAVTTAEVTDRNGAVKMVEHCAEDLQGVKNVLADGGYTGEEFADEILSALGATVQIAKRSQLHMFVVIPQRWIVERSFAWSEKNRRLWKNCERKLNASLQFINLAFLALLLRRF
jgi:transposase